MITTTRQQENRLVPAQIEDITQWHHDRNLIDGSDDITQFGKLMEEVIELFMTLNPDMKPMDGHDYMMYVIDNLYHNGRIKQAPEGKTIADDVGDINVVLINLMERNGLTMQECFAVAWDDIKDRKGEMRNGVFVKEADL